MKRDLDAIRRALEQSLTFERGILQLAGLTVTYDLSRPKYSRVVSVHRNGKPVADNERFTVAGSGFLTEGGDLYDSFAESGVIGSYGKVADAIVAYFQAQELITVPARGRQLPLDSVQ